MAYNLGFLGQDRSWPIFRKNFPLPKKVKEIQGDDPKLCKIKEDMEKGEMTNFLVDPEGNLRFGGWLCVPDVESV